MNKRMLVTAALNLVLIAPATLFMAALVIRSLAQPEAATAAQRIVMWYANRFWTLWLLLLALPLVVLATGCIALFGDWIEGPGAEQPLASVRTHPANLLVAALTFGAACILVIVLLHMLAD
jgi:hypothetical protein